MSRYEVDGVDIQTLPKVSLHDHLDGGLRPQTILELGDEIGLELPASDAASLGEWFATQSNSGSLPEYLKTFDITTAVMQTEHGLHRVAKEFVLDLAEDGVIYGEIRWAPEQHLQRGLSLDAAVEAVQAGIEEAIGLVASHGGRIRVGQLVSAMRHLDRADEIAELALRHRGKGAVGFDIAGPEDGFPASRLQSAFDILAKAHFPATVHAGEGAGIDSITDALFSGRALRLGHGTRIAEDIVVEEESDEAIVVRLGEVAEWVKDRQIALEVSPSSNLQTGTIAQWGESLADHPIDLLHQLGFCVTVNTDNRLQSSTTLTRELGLLVETFEWDLDDLEQVAQNAAASAFCTFEESEQLADEISDGFDDLR
ncbi:adenosine deaminase [Agrococcus sp. ARC_14]|uniref:adenosine deaminase n=1 Tax=Agrococcus sp. ARC_14 TaxID=2919927 RepID=UPI001F062F18|nr:adenosine deaminase [Agrococcus sp. ARC_14]MCH1882291.1 adenosine deaminase [Agrococcus sp. ARC_14]